MQLFRKMRFFLPFSLWSSKSLHVRPVQHCLQKTLGQPPDTECGVLRAWPDANREWFQKYSLGNPFLSCMMGGKSAHVLRTIRGVVFNCGMQFQHPELVPLILVKTWSLTDRFPRWSRSAIIWVKAVKVSKQQRLWILIWYWLVLIDWFYFYTWANSVHVPITSTICIHSPYYGYPCGYPQIPAYRLDLLTWIVQHWCLILWGS